jgi:hypothetical protein
MTRTMISKPAERPQAAEPMRWQAPAHSENPFLQDANTISTSPKTVVTAKVETTFPMNLPESTEIKLAPTQESSSSEDEDDGSRSSKTQLPHKDTDTNDKRKDHCRGGSQRFRSFAGGGKSLRKLFNKKEKGISKVDEIADVVYALRLEGGNDSASAAVTAPNTPNITRFLNRGKASPLAAESATEENGVFDAVASKSFRLPSLETSTNPYDQIMRLRSCELDPSKHQLDLPKSEEILIHARVCHLMESYQHIVETSGIAFDFKTLVGLSRIELEGMYTRLTMPSAGLVDTSQAPQAHPSVIKSLLECAVDMTVQGFFEDSSGDQVAVFATQHHRQFIVCYRGCQEKQRKPVKKDESEVLALYPSDHKVPIHATFRDAYFSDNLEPPVFGLLNILTDESPFCDVVYTGHSFGGALATIGAVRYAENYPIVTVSSHMFGSPRVGQKEFRDLAHSLPNLKIIRVDNGKDPYVFFPEGKKWTHLGHTIRLTMGESDDEASSAKAFKFDDKERREADGDETAIKKQVLRCYAVGGKKTKKMKKDHELRQYIDSIENFTHMGLPWVSHFEGDSGTGITVTTPTGPGSADGVAVREEARIVV